MKELGNQLWQMFTKPVSKFLEEGILGGVLLMIATVVALIWANSPLQENYETFLHLPVAFGVGDFVYDESLHHFINDGLMVLFFFVVGLEIKRELLVGELCEPKKALLPAVAALGGMLVPALLYTLLNAGGTYAGGWGIPMATDIAFALGVLALLGNKVPLSLKVFLLALAIFDDMGAILVIALFYGGEIRLMHLAAAGLLLGLSIVLNALGVRKSVPYGIIGVALWVVLLNSGIHATIAGVLLAFTIPARSKQDHHTFKQKTGKLVSNFPDTPVEIMVTDEEQREFMKKIQCSVDDLNSPLQKLEDGLHGVANFIILPIFALANAGVSFLTDGGLNLLHPVSLGIFAGLILGKPLGIFLSVFLCGKLGWLTLPEGATTRQLLGIGCLGGIGFTMSIFVTNLAFGTGDAANYAKIAILLSSLVSAVLGMLLLSRAPGDKS